MTAAADLIEPGRTGDVFPFGDWDRLAQLLTEYSGDRDRLSTMGQQAQRQIERYSPEAAARGIVAAVRVVAAPRKSGALESAGTAP